jgi:hypothetical protein
MLHIGLLGLKVNPTHYDNPYIYIVVFCFLTLKTLIFCIYTLNRADISLKNGCFK